MVTLQVALEVNHHEAGTQVDLKLFVRSKTGDEKRDIIDQLAVELGLNDDSLPEMVAGYQALLGGSAETLEMMRSLGQGGGVNPDAVVDTLKTGGMGEGQPTVDEAVTALGLFYRLAGAGLSRGEQAAGKYTSNLQLLVIDGPVSDRLLVFSACALFGLCVGEVRRRRVLEGLRGGPLPTPLPAEPDQLSAMEQQMLLAQLLTQHDIEADEFVEAAVSVASKGGAAAEGLGSVLGLLGKQDVSKSGGSGKDVTQLASMLGAGLQKKRQAASALQLVTSGMQTDPEPEVELSEEVGFDEFMRRLAAGELSAEELRALGVAFLQHADGQQLRELLEDIMADGSASQMMKAIVSEKVHMCNISSCNIWSNFPSVFSRVSFCCEMVAMDRIKRQRPHVLPRYVIFCVLCSNSPCFSGSF